MGSYGMQVKKPLAHKILL